MSEDRQNTDNKLTVDTEKIRLAIRSGVPLSITTYTLPHNMEVYMEEVLTQFLKELGQDQMVAYLVYCQNELITNAKKANTKRVYFKEKGLDITNEEDYEKGMVNFKEDTLNNINHYLKLQKQEGLYVRLELQMKNQYIKLEVHNNSELTYFEYRRIHDKLSRAQQYTSVEDAMSQILDDTEGAGLGLVILILMLEKIGVTEENFQTIARNGETITRIILPLSQETHVAIDTISEEFEKTIEELPQFPDNIAKLNRLLSDPDSKMSDIAMQISNDVALTGELLKQVNSAAFALSTPCSNISDAVKYIGIRGIRNMLYTIGTVKSFATISVNADRLWTHAHKVALYSYNLALNFCSKYKTVIADSYICGLLHDMGKIVFESIHPESLEKMHKVCEERHIAPVLMEHIISGVNHAEIGARIAERWHFPENIVSVIRYHHTPELAPEDSKMLCSIVYLADLITHYQEQEVDYYQIDPLILEEFNIASQQQLDTISEKLGFIFNQTHDK